MANIDFPSTPTIGQKYVFAGVTYTFTAQGVWSPGSSISTMTPPQGRLTLQSNVPVMTSTVTGVTVVFYTPYLGNRLPLYNGQDMMMTSFSELSGSATDATKNPAIIGANKLNDWFVWRDTDGTLRLGHGPDWTSDTVRSDGTILIRVQGVLVNSVDITNGPKAQKGTYVGTTRSDAASHFVWMLGSAALGGGEALLYVWNTYNRVLATATVRDSTGSWTWGGGSYVPLNQSVKNRISFISGLIEDVVICNLFINISGNSSLAVVAMCIDAIDSVDAQAVFTTPPGSAIVSGMLGHNFPAQIGWHFFQAMQYYAAGNATTYYGGIDEGFNGLFRM